MEKGEYIKLYKSMKSHWLWTEKPFNKGTALIDLVLSADDNSNELLTSMSSLSHSWGWSKVEVYNFLNLLQHEEVISKRKTKDKQKWIIKIKGSKYFEL